MCMPAKLIRLFSYGKAILDAILGSECSNNGLKSYMHMTIQYKITLQDKMNTKTHTYCTLYSFSVQKILFGSHL